MSSASKKKRRKRRPRQPAPAATADAAPQAAAETEPRQRPRRARPAIDERPPAPWGSFPLVELVVLIGLIMIVIGLIVGFDENRGQLLLATGVMLAALAGLELSVREHFAGYRSHTTLLAAVGGLATLLALYYVFDLAPAVAAAVGAGVGLACAYLLVRLFREKSGGHSVKIR